MFYEEIAEAIKKKRLDTEAGGGGSAGGGGAGGGAGAGASGGASAGGTSSGGDGGSADSGGTGSSSSATSSSDSPSSDSTPTSYRGGFFVGYGGYGVGTYNPSRKKKKKKKKKKLTLDKKGIYEKETTPKKDRALDVYDASGIEKLPLGKKGIYEDREKLEQRLDQLESALGMARDTTRNIKYVDTHIEILSKLGGIAEDVGLELDKYDESKVLELKNALESAIYQLEEPFEDAIRDIQNQIDDLDYED